MMHIRSIQKIALQFALAWTWLFASSCVLAQTVPGCGTLSSPGQYGPFDYRTDRPKLPIVDNAHFTPEIESLIRGRTTSVGGEIDYTLRAFPNHHRALIAMMRLAERDKTPNPHGSNYSITCWFERAIQFRPDDVVVRMIYSSFLYKSGKQTEALYQLEVADHHAKDNGFTHYNIGLHYFDMKEFDKALAQAHRAAELGIELPALRERLQSVGKWSDTPAASSEVKPVN